LNTSFHVQSQSTLALLVRVGGKQVLHERVDAGFQVRMLFGDERVAYDADEKADEERGLDMLVYKHFVYEEFAHSRSNCKQILAKSLVISKMDKVWLVCSVAKSRKAGTKRHETA
jgi:hypothetical protein